MKQVTINISAPDSGIAKANGFKIVVQRPETLEEARSLGWTDEEIISHLNRDENSNVGNASRAALVAAIEGGIKPTETDKLAEIVNKAAEAYESGERVSRQRGGAAAHKAKAFSWASQNPEAMAACMQASTEAQASGSNPMEAAMQKAVELYNAAHPKE